jgi:hypothetical protein
MSLGSDSGKDEPLVVEEEVSPQGSFALVMSKSHK